MKKRFILVMAMALVFALLSGCSAGYRLTEDNRLIGNDGTEYAFLSYEGWYAPLGELEYVGSIRNDPDKLEAVYEWICGYGQPGLYKIKGDTSGDLLFRYEVYSEWCAIYRNVESPPLYTTLEKLLNNISRLELVMPHEHPYLYFRKHIDCGEGITDPETLREFFRDIRSQESPQDAGLYEMMQANENHIQLCGYLYAYFEEEPNLIHSFEVYSYNDVAYSITIGYDEYVLPNEWLQKLETAEH